MKADSTKAESIDGINEQTYQFKTLTIINYIINYFRD